MGVEVIWLVVGSIVSFWVSVENMWLAVGSIVSSEMGMEIMLLLVRSIGVDCELVGGRES